MLHLCGAGLHDGLVPRHERKVLRRALGRPHLPDRVMTVGVTEGAAEQVPIQRPPDIRRDGMAKILRVE